jgi:hypothetical protein
MSYKTIQLAYDSGVATITLNRPDKRNAISFELIDDLLGALREVEASLADRLRKRFLPLDQMLRYTRELVTASKLLIAAA